jgi:hypothetical protein
MDVSTRQRNAPLTPPSLAPTLPAIATNRPVGR